MAAVKEARDVAEGCRIMAATKIRPALLAPLNSIRTNVSTNLQVLQSSVLLAQHYRPLYAFLARHASRVSIDVQRAYVAAARLYFETGFRRYARVLTTIRNRSLAQDVHVLMGEEVPAAGFGASAVAFLSRNARTEKDVDPHANDTWLQWDIKRLKCARSNGPTVLLAYQADDANLRASPELLYRSLSLVLFDNACSEYAFIVRFFDQLPSPTSLAEDDYDEEDEDEAEDTVGELGSGFNGSFSLASGPSRRRSVTNITRLTMKEQRTQQGRVAADELWKQVMEPALGHWLSFIKVVLNASATPPPLLSLATMLRLTAHLLSASLARGASSVLHPVLLAFRNEAGPLLRKSLEDNIESVRKVADVAAAAAGVSTSTGSENAGGAGGLFGGLVRVAAGGGGTTPEKVTDDFVRLVASRYARAYSSLAELSEEGDDEGYIFNEMFRMRSELERLIHAQAKRAAKTSAAAQHLALGTFDAFLLPTCAERSGPAAHPSSCTLRALTLG